MSEVSCWNSVVFKEFLLEGEDAEQALDCAAHGFNASLSPCPGLWCDQVNYRDLQLPQFLGQAEMKIGGIGQDGEIGLAIPRGAD